MSDRVFQVVTPPTAQAAGPAATSLLWVPNLTGLIRMANAFPNGANSNNSEMCSDGEFVYMTPGPGIAGHAIYRVNLATFAVDTGLWTGLDAPGRTGIAVDSEFLYLEAGNAPTPGIYRAPVIGGPWTLIAIGTYGGNNCAQMVVTASSIFCFNDTGALIALNIDGTSPVAFINDGIFRTGITTDGNFVYYGVSGRNPPTVGRIAVDGSGRNDLWWQPGSLVQFDAMDMAYDSVTNRLYLARFTNGDIVYCDVGNPLSTILFPMATGPHPIGLCIT